VSILCFPQTLWKILAASLRRRFLFYVVSAFKIFPALSLRCLLKQIIAGFRGPAKGTASSCAIRGAYR